MKVLVAGATGTVGRHVVRSLVSSGYSVRALSRHSDSPANVGAHEIHTGDLTAPGSITGACSGIDAVISCAGASLKIGFLSQRSGFLSIDYAGNRNLLAEARRAGVTRFIYVSLAGAAGLLATEYAEAHERFANELIRSGIACTIMRPTGLFSTFAELLPMARLGIMPLVGSGLARTNPIHEADVAQACKEALSGTEETRTIGGPETFTRHRLAELPFDALGKTPQLLSLPPVALRAAVRLWKPLHPRISAVIDFGLQVTQMDVIAPRYGARRLGDYLRALTAAEASGADGASPRSPLRQ